MENYRWRDTSIMTTISAWWCRYLWKSNWRRAHWNKQYIMLWKSALTWTKCLNG